MNEETAIRLRAVRAEDEPAVRALVFGILAAYGLAPSPADTDADLFDLPGFYADRGGDFSVLVDGERIIGTVGLHRVSEEVAELRKMYLDADYRGRGLGRLLLEHALGRARELGFARVTLETASVLREAVALYERYGFYRSEPGHLAARCDVAMVRELESEENAR